MKAIGAAGELWLRPFRSAALTHQPQADTQPASAGRSVAGAEREPGGVPHGAAIELNDAALRDALHGRLADLQAFLNDAMAGQFVRRAAMSETLEGMRTELAAALDELGRLRGERLAHGTELAELRTEAEGLRAALQAREEALQLQIGERESLIAALTAERDALVVAVDEVRTETGRMHDAQDEEILRLENDLTEALTALEQARSRADAGAARIAWLEPALETTRAEVDALRGEDDDRDGLQARLDALEPQLADAARVIAEACEARDGAEARLAQLEPLVAALRADLEAVRAERDLLLGRAGDLETELATVARERDADLEAARAGSARMAELEAALTALRSGIERVGAERDEAQALAVRVQAGAGELEARLETLGGEAERARRERDALVARVAALEADLVRRGPVAAEPPGTAVVGRAQEAAQPTSADAPSSTASGAPTSVAGLPAAAVAQPHAPLPMPGEADRVRQQPEGHAGPIDRSELRTPADPRALYAAPNAASSPAPSATPNAVSSPAPSTPPAALATAPAAAPGGVTRLPVRGAALEVHFHKPAAWADTLFMHFWTPTGLASVWPGVRMVGEGAGWFVARIEGAGEAMLVFNDSCGHQTPDLRREGDGWFADGEWRNDRPAEIVRLADRPGWPDKVVLR
jgi:uncharacterized coiled-coil DUF342 family protein